MAAALRMTTGSVTVMLDRLERVDYVVRQPDPVDRRRVLVRATPEVVRRAWQVYGPLAHEGEQMLLPYATAELEVIIDFLTRSRELQQRHLDRLRPPAAGH